MTPARQGARGLAGVLPRKAPKPDRPVRHGAHFWLEDEAGMVLLQRRPPRGLLGGTLALPGTAVARRAVVHGGGTGGRTRRGTWHLAGMAEHGFTHFTLRAEVYAARATALPPGGEQRRRQRRSKRCRRCSPAWPGLRQVCLAPGKQAVRCCHGIASDRMTFSYLDV